MRHTLMRELGLTIERLRTQGLRETLKVIPEYLLHKYLDVRDGFDREHGTDTVERMAIADADAQGTNIAEGKVYWPVDRKQFLASLRRLSISHGDFVFIDLGSGKGRALLIASEFPFQRIIGVEFSRTLHDIAQRNSRIFRSPRQRCTEIELHCQDAATFVFPEQPLVIFLFYPFGPEVLRRVVENLRQSLQVRNRPLHLIYHHPLNDELLLENGLFVLAAEEPDRFWRFGYRVYVHEP
jgi:SAM-dependent methyltransferase